MVSNRADDGCGRYDGAATTDDPGMFTGHAFTLRLARVETSYTKVTA